MNTLPVLLSTPRVCVFARMGSMRSRNLSSASSPSYGGCLFLNTLISRSSSAAAALSGDMRVSKKTAVAENSAAIIAITATRVEDCPASTAARALALTPRTAIAITPDDSRSPGQLGDRPFYSLDISGRGIFPELLGDPCKNVSVALLLFLRRRGHFPRELPADEFAAESLIAPGERKPVSGLLDDDCNLFSVGIPWHMLNLNIVEVCAEAAVIEPIEFPEQFLELQLKSLQVGLLVAETPELPQGWLGRLDAGRQRVDHQGPEVIGPGSILARLAGEVDHPLEALSIRREDGNQNFRQQHGADAARIRQ